LVHWIEVYHGKNSKKNIIYIKQSKTPVGLEATKEAMVALITSDKVMDHVPIAQRILNHGDSSKRPYE